MTPVTGVVSASFSGKLFWGGVAILVCGSGNRLRAAKLNLEIVSDLKDFSSHTSEEEAGSGLRSQS